MAHLASQYMGVTPPPPPRVSACKVSNDLNKYLQKQSIFKDCLESDVHHTIFEILQIFKL